MSKRTFRGNNEGGGPSLEISPARLDSNQTAKILGFSLHNIPVLVSAKMLIPLGNPVPNAPKYFARVEIEQLAVNRDWLDKATKTVSKVYKVKNEKQRQKRGSREPQATV